MYIYYRPEDGSVISARAEKEEIKDFGKLEKDYKIIEKEVTLAHYKVDLTTLELVEVIIEELIIEPTEA